MISQQQIITALQHQRLVVVSVLTLSRWVVGFLILASVQSEFQR